MPDFRDYAIKVEQARADRGGEHPARSGAFLRDIMRQNMTNFRVFCPDENTSNKLDAIYEVSKKLWLADYLPEDADGGELVHRRPRPGDALRAHAGRLARRLPAHRPPRVLLDLRSVRPRHRFDVQPARQVAGDLQRAALAGADLVAEPADHLHGLAAGSQRLHAPGSRLPRCRGQQEPGCLPHLPAAGRQLRCSASPTTA